MDVNDNEELNAIREGGCALCAEFPAECSANLDQPDPAVPGRATA
jgi:hypothetical protein